MTLDLDAGIDYAPERGAANYDVDHIRTDFPILFREVYGKPLVYLDNGASAQKPRAVLEAMDHVYRFEYANVHRGLHYLSNATTAKYEDARETVRRFLNAGSSDEIIFTRNATMAINLVAQSFGGMVIDEQDEIILSIMEHHSNIVPWNYHRERKGAVLKWAPVSDNGEFLLEEFEALITPRIKIVAITHMSNVLGTVVPFREVITAAHEHGIPVLVDGSQAAVHMPVDVAELGCDFYCITGHKLYGPTGSGALYVRRQRMAEMRPFMGGGDMIREVSQDAVSYNSPPHKFEAGTPGIVQMIGLGAALDYMTGLGMDRIAAHEQDLRDYASERFAGLNWLNLQGTAPGKGAIFSFTLRGPAHAHDISTVVDRKGVAVRAGHHCAQPLMERLGETATCRASFGLYNTRGEVDALVDALETCHALFD